MPSAETWGQRYRAARSWDESTRVLMLASKALPILSESERRDDAEVRGCESRVWLVVEVAEQRINLRAHSDGKIVRGLLQLVTEPIQQADVSAFKRFDFDEYLTALGLEKYLSPSRNSGVASIVTRLKALQSRY